MLMSATEFVILDPRAAPPVAISPYRLKADVSRRGLRVALFSNGFYDATNLMKAVEAALRPALNEPVFSLYARLNASVTAPPEVIAEAVRSNDVAVTALGHCGSCTSSATRDAVALAGAGIPAAAMVAPVIPGLNDSEIEPILKAVSATGVKNAGYVLLRLPLEVKDIFREWLMSELPDRASRVLSLIRQTRQGKEYDATFGRRMTGTGPYAWAIGRRFELACEQLGLNRESTVLSTEHFRRSPQPGEQMSLL